MVNNVDLSNSIYNLELLLSVLRGVARMKKPMPRKERGQTVFVFFINSILCRVRDKDP